MTKPLKLDDLARAIAGAEYGDGYSRPYEPFIAHARAILTTITEAQVLEIRGSVISPKELAAEYGVSHYTIADIRARKSWAWLEDAAMLSAAPQIEGE